MQLNMRIRFSWLTSASNVINLIQLQQAGAREFHNSLSQSHSVTVVYKTLALSMEKNARDYSDKKS